MAEIWSNRSSLAAAAERQAWKGSFVLQQQIGAKFGRLAAAHPYGVGNRRGVELAAMVSVHAVRATRLEVAAVEDVAVAAAFPPASRAARWQREATPAPPRYIVLPSLSAFPCSPSTAAAFASFPCHPPSAASLCGIPRPPLALRGRLSTFPRPLQRRRGSASPLGVAADLRRGKIRFQRFYK